MKKKTILILLIILISIFFIFIYLNKPIKKNISKIDSTENKERSYSSNIIENVKYTSRDTNGNEYTITALKGEIDIKDSDCVISGPSSSIHEVALLWKIYTVLWPFDDYENEYLSNDSIIKNIEDLNHKILKLNNDLSYQNSLFSQQLIEAQKFINIDSDSSTKNIIQHIISENIER